MKLIDIYGESIKITINKNPKVKSNLGGYFTILTVLLISVAIFVIGKDIVEKKDPLSIFQLDTFLKMIPVNITSYNDMPIAVEIENLSGLSFNDESVLNLNLIFVQLKFESNGTKIMMKKETPLEI